MNHEPFKNVAESIQSIITSVALIVGGIWAAWRFVLNREGKALIEPELDIVFVHTRLNLCQGRLSHSLLLQ
jgi:hypothetical protein